MAVLSALYRLWGTIRAPLGRRWGVEQATFWGDALRGASALRAGLHKATMDGLVGAEGGQRSTL